MTKEIIKFEQFNFQYLAQSEPTLSDINLSIKKGEKVLIIGPSGSGKSTLTSCINGLIPGMFKGTIEGKLSIVGEDTASQGIFERSKLVGTVLQDLDAQFIGLTVGEDIAFSMENDETQLAEMQQRVSASAGLVGMADFLDHEPHALSGGQKQKVSLAGVLVDQVPILLFDEPLANLDPRAGQSAIELIDQLGKESETTTLIIEHRLEDVLHRQVDRIILIDEGKIVADTTPDKLLASGMVAEHGIREPLYVAALKYAGLTVTEAMKPSSLEQLTLSETEKAEVRDWFSEPIDYTVEENNENLLSINHLNFEYDAGKPVLRDVTFDITKGEFIAIVGQNGAGKSTLSKLICGFEKVAKDQILWEGQDMSDWTILERAQHVGYVMQDPNQMISKAMIYDEVAMGLRSQGTLSDEQIEKRVFATLKICGLYEMRNWPISALSFGQKKRVTIASILALEPECLILDEPTAGQDYKHYTEIMTFLESLNKQGITIIIITHDMHLMLEYAKRVLVFGGGHRLLADLKPEEVLTQADLLKEASLKETSLYRLAEICGITDRTGFIRHFIDFERARRSE